MKVHSHLFQLFRESLVALLHHPRLRFWLMIIGTVFALLGFQEVVDDIFYDPLEGDYESRHFDKLISDSLQGLRTAKLTQLMTDLTALGSISVILTAFIIFVIVAVTFRNYKGIPYVSIVLLGAGLWPLLLKLYFARERPPEADRLVQVTDLSFPSGHSFGAIAAYIAFAYYVSLYARRWTQELIFFCIAGTLASLVAMSRVYLSVHYTTDVLAGICGGLAWGLMATAFYEYLRKS